MRCAIRRASRSATSSTKVCRRTTARRSPRRKAVCSFVQLNGDKHGLENIEGHGSEDQENPRGQTGPGHVNHLGSCRAPRRTRANGGCRGRQEEEGQEVGNGQKCSTSLAPMKMNKGAPFVSGERPRGREHGMCSRDVPPRRRRSCGCHGACISEN